MEATKEGGKEILRVTVPDPILGQRLELDADVLSLAAAVIPSAGTREVAGLFKVTLSPDDFFKEAHVKLKPVEFAAEGVFLCGMAHYPKHIPESINQARRGANIASLDVSEAVASLTPQQFRVASMLVEGLLNKQIAYELDVTEATIKAHMTEIFKKLGVHSRTQAVLALNTLALEQPSELVAPPEH